MKIKTFLITVILSVIVATIMTSGATYAVFSDSEVSTNNEMTVSIHYYTPPDNYTPTYGDPVTMVKCGTGSVQGIFEYDNSSHEFFYNVSCTIKDNGFSHIWMLVAYENPTNFFHIGSGETDNTTKIVTFNGSKDLNRDLVNATMLIFDDHYWNATYMDLNTTKIVGCRCSVENVNYHDIDTYPE